LLTFGKALKNSAKKTEAQAENNGIIQPAESAGHFG
jgi:hypothetical protein